MIDLRSDTVTRPTPQMLEAMMQAETGDDVFGEDTTVNTFEKKVAAMFGKEAGLFVPSGTMSNQLGLKVLTRPGDEILIDEKGHIFNYETGAASMLSGIQIHTLKGTKGKLDADVLLNTVRGNYDWEPRTRVICIENTTNKGGGVCYGMQELQDIRSFADHHNLAVHLDGARIWNAVEATGMETEFFGSIADTISVCFSKGLGAPVGSMLLASGELIREARRYRKMWGGGMRQVGLLAAAADYAIENHRSLLAEDHRRAKELAEVISECPDLSVDKDAVQTNILIFNTLKESAAGALEKLQAHDIQMVPFGPETLRATFHFQTGDTELQKVKDIMKMLFG